ncbi:hypothetical protein [Ottowia testudinis]|uniref:4'-phosphopantetheinyl transferase n=1 Tax=Ottowia testudinis TaxID=2816950 RepID=A0A975CH85_9BURK|nr:hypothetical protein [Ottowia testudinis]QTD45732.1 hypothetical protein J1M35_02060 [Ottowia testudinis]
MSATALACDFDGAALPGAPRVLALAVPAGQSPEATRRHARQLARAVLADALGAWLGCDARAIAISDVRGQAPRATLVTAAPQTAWADRLAATGLSISHAPGLTLAAWRPAGAVGVDVQALHEAPMDAEEAQRVAALYLGPNSVPNHPRVVEKQARTAIDIAAFTAAWAAHEARLKCLDEPLQEWSPALQARLAACQVRPLIIPAAAGGGRRWQAAVAWA